MKLLLIPANYPHPSAEWVGTQNERSAAALRQIVDHVEVFVPRPYAPRLVAFTDRWKPYTTTPRLHVRNDIRVHRPAYPVFPGFFQALWPTRVAALFTRNLARVLHREMRFDAILSFDLARAGGLAWRLGEDLSIPACGWATGSDIRYRAGSAIGRGVREALGKLNLVFYQSAELKSLGAQLLGTDPQDLPAARHIVQARGVSEPETLPGADARRSVRCSLGVADKVVVLYLGRIARAKGLFDLVAWFAGSTQARERLMLVLVGSRPGHDDATELDGVIRSHQLGERIRILPGCEPQSIWDYLAAADVFAFPSFREGMPNSLLEAMLAKLPAVAFSIPPVREITRFGTGLVEVPAYDFPAFGQALLELAADASRRREIGERGRAIARMHFSVHTSMRTVVRHIDGLLAGWSAPRAT